MRSHLLGVSAFFITLGMIGVTLAAEGEVKPTRSTTRTTTSAKKSLDSTLRVAKTVRKLSVPKSALQIMNRSATAGVTTGTRVYRNEIDEVGGVSLPGAGRYVTDDMTLADGPCELSKIELLVFGFSPPDNNAVADIQVSVWDDDPCAPGATMLPGSQRTVTGIPNNNELQLVTIFYDPPVSLERTVWVTLTPSEEDFGWAVAEHAELGTTREFFGSEDAGGCGLFVLTSGSWGGFFANLYCSLPPQIGACCDGTTCTQTLEGDCTGTWQGAFTTCEPNVCQSGICCTGLAFDSCGDTNDATCFEGTFQGESTCEFDLCPASFKVYENDFQTNSFTTTGAGENYLADDLTFGPGTPCDLSAYRVFVLGDDTVSGGPATFTIHTELWSNDNAGTLGVEEDDTPLEPIPGTLRAFKDVLTLRISQPLFAEGFEGILLSGKVWLLMWTTNDDGTPLEGIGGPALGGAGAAIDIGDSLDLFVVTDSLEPPITWTAAFFGGFDPNANPLIPAASFQIDVWCGGDPPTGACCDADALSCTEGVTPGACDGRWERDGTCELGTFNPPCGTAACCFPFPLNPEFVQCVDFSQQDCDVFDGLLSPGSFCGDLDFPGCPGARCFGHIGDCFAENGTTGCEDPFCTAKVCEADEFCCGPQEEECTDATDTCCSNTADPTGTWDADCAVLGEALCREAGSNDDCTGATAITAVGIYEFDNTEATQDGPPHAACDFGGQDQINRDLWYHFTSPCTDRVFVRTCGLVSEAMDTKMAVYQGTACPPADADVLDCNDDLCPLASMVLFDAVQGEEYTIRLGIFPDPPGAPGGTGSFEITCGPPPNGVCPSASACCDVTDDAQPPGCEDEVCCATVCACDEFCCTDNFDGACSRLGFGDSGCGAELLCEETCGAGCPTGEVVFLDSGVIDAGQPFDPTTGAPLQGIDTIIATGPEGAGPNCWSLCETLLTGNANFIVEVVEDAGSYTIMLDRPITPGAVTTITYTDEVTTETTGFYTAHPANANGDTIADANDVLSVIDYLNGDAMPPFGMFSMDVDRSGDANASDILRIIDLLNGGGNLDEWLDSPRPSSGRDCP